MKSVLKYDISGKFIGKYKSLKKASYENNIGSGDICNCCKGNKLYAGNFIWFYEERFSKKELNIRLKQIKEKDLWATLKKKVLQMNPKTNKIIKVWESTMEAYRETNINGIYAVANGNHKQKTAGGYIWKYEKK